MTFKGCYGYGVKQLRKTVWINLGVNPKLYMAFPFVPQSPGSLFVYEALLMSPQISGRLSGCVFEGMAAHFSNKQGQR